MFNVKVFMLKDLIKYIIKLLVIIICIYFIVTIMNFNKNMDNKEETQGQLRIEYCLTDCIDTSSSIIKCANKSKENEKKAYKAELYEDILKSQIGLMDSKQLEYSSVQAQETEIDKEYTDSEKSVLEKEIQKNDIVQTITTGLKTEVITKNPIPLNYNSNYGNVKIKNETSFDLNSDILNPDVVLDNKNILIFHTHTCESYTNSEKYSYNPTGNFRTTDLDFTVARLGKELKNNLEGYGYNVYHDTTYHDYPAYNGSYTRSLETVQNILNNTPTDIIFDIHRDAIGSRSDYAPCVKIGDDVAAQIMFVIGSNEGGLWHPNWKQNLKFAIKVQQKGEELFPGLFKPITFTKYRYNQHAGKYASIIEVGATGNTLDQCINSMKYFSKVLDEVLK